MTLDYFDCISPLPLDLVNVGSIKSPKLIEIAEISYYTYSLYIAHLKMTPEEYFETYHKDKEVDTESIFYMTKFDLLLADDNFRKIITSAINFFFVEDFEFNPEYTAFVSITKNENGEIVGIKAITKDNYSDVVDIILQRVRITSNEDEISDLKKVKSKRGLKIYKKILQGRKKMQKIKASNKNLTLANIIAAVVSKSESLNWSNVWDITVFQLFDLFDRMQRLDSYNIESAQVAAWGNKDGKFKFGAWIDNVYETEDATK